MRVTMIRMQTHRTPHSTAVEVAMKRQGVSQRALAEVLGISQAAVSRRLAGEPDFTVTELRAIAQALEVEASALIQGVAK